VGELGDGEWCGWGVGVSDGGVLGVGVLCGDGGSGGGGWCGHGESDGGGDGLLGHLEREVEWCVGVLGDGVQGLCCSSRVGQSCVSTRGELGRRDTRQQQCWPSHALQIGRTKTCETRVKCRPQNTGRAAQIRHHLGSLLCARNASPQSRIPCSQCHLLGPVHRCMTGLPELGQH